MPTGRLLSDRGVSRGLRVGVIGGSIAGCAVAVELERAGCDVTVFERSPGSLKDRGAGIGIPFALLKLLQGRDLVDPDMAIEPIRMRHFVIRSPRGERILWKQSFVIAATSWDVLYQNLRQRVRDEIYCQDHEVTALHGSADGAVVEFATGQQAAFDLVVSADGYTSIGRRRLFPAQTLQYAGYIMWRGLLDERLVSDVAPYDGVNIFAVSPLGHLIAYLVPGKQGETQPGKRRLNWGWYVNTPQVDLAQSLTDRDGRTHATSLPAGSISDERASELRDLARNFMPRFIAEAVARTERPFIQAIFDLHVPNFRRGNILLLGDASSVVRPHAAAGATKALYSAIALAESLKTQRSVNTALSRWNDEQCREGGRLVSLSQKLGQALQNPARDWDSMDEQDMSRWWKSVIGNEKWHVMTDED